MKQVIYSEGTEKTEMSLTRKLTALADGLNVYSELTGLLHTPPPTTVHLLQLFLCQLLSLLLAVLFILLHNRINFKLLNLLLINVSGMSLFPFDIAKVRQLSEQDKLFADFRQNYMRHGSAFATIC